jgi:hypothetical protein
MWFFVPFVLLIGLLVGCWLYAELQERRPANIPALERRLRYAVIAMLEAGMDEYDVTQVCETAHQDWWLTQIVDQHDE